MLKGLEPWQTEERCLRSILPTRAPKPRPKAIKEAFEEGQARKLYRDQCLLQKREKEEQVKWQQAEARALRRASRLKTLEQRRSGSALGRRLPTKTEARDYKVFVSQMTKKIKEGLTKELHKKELRYTAGVVKEAWSSAKDSDPVACENALKEQNRTQKELFHSDGKSHALKNIREKLDRETQRMQGLLFLKQLELENSGKVVWERSTLQMIKSIEQEQNRLRNTDFGKALQKRKPRPHDIIQGNSKEILFQEEYRTEDVGYTYFNSTHSQQSLLDEMPFDSAEKSQQDLIKIEEEDQKSTADSKALVSPERHTNPFGASKVVLSSQRAKEAAEKHSSFLQLQRNNLNSTHQNSSTAKNGDKGVTTATSMSYDEAGIVSSFNSNRSLLAKNPPAHYQPK